MMALINKRDINRWDYLWRLFARDIFFKPNPKVTDEIIKLFNGGIAGKKILEVGSGSGSDCITLAKLGGQCFALDFSPEASKTCQRLAQKAKVKLKTIVADCRQIPARSDYFDLVFSVGLMEHFKKPIPLLKEQLRVLKRGGLLLVDVPQKYHLYTFVKHLRMKFNRHPFGWETEYSVSDLKRFGRQLKLKPIHFYGRESVLTDRLALPLKAWWKKIFAKIETSRLAPFVCLNVGVVYQK
jgi:SAM-dependent methyltransferase